MISVQNLHTFKLEANAKLISKISTEQHLKKLVGRQNGKDFILLGEGSNTVFVEDYLGEVVKVDLYGKSFKENDKDFLVTVKASENWHQFVCWLLDNNIYGLENLALIPGTVGAAPVQNIGAYGVEVKKFVESVTYFDSVLGKLATLSNDECNFGYRDSIFKNELRSSSIITEVTFRISKNWIGVCSYGELANLDSPTPKNIFNKVVEIRQAKLPDPLQLGNAGSFFKNPIIDEVLASKIKSKYEELPVYPVTTSKVKLAAGWLIDQCGLKGYELDGIGVHKDQALVLVNKSGNANGKALLKMITRVQQQVFDKFEVSLEPEVRLVGMNGEITVSEKF